MSMLDTFQSDDYSDGRTKQAFKDQTDINRLLDRAAKGQTLSHLQRHGAQYGDFTDVDDLMDAQAKLARGQQIFSELPSEIRKEFANDVGAFYRYVNDPANADRLPELLPDLAKPGRQLPAVVRTAETEAGNPSPASQGNGQESTEGERVVAPQPPST